MIPSFSGTERDATRQRRTQCVSASSCFHAKNGHDDTQPWRLCARPWWWWGGTYDMNSSRRLFGKVPVLICTLWMCVCVWWGVFLAGLHYTLPHLSYISLKCECVCVSVWVLWSDSMTNYLPCIRSTDSLIFLCMHMLQPLIINCQKRQEMRWLVITQQSLCLAPQVQVGLSVVVHVHMCMCIGLYCFVFPGDHLWLCTERAASKKMCVCETAAPYKARDQYHHYYTGWKLCK